MQPEHTRLKHLNLGRLLIRSIIDLQYAIPHTGRVTGLYLRGEMPIRAW